MLDPTKLSPRARGLAAGVIHRAWDWIGIVGSIGPSDRKGRRFRSMGEGSCISFPPGAVFNENWISIGTGTLIGPHVSLAVGFPVEVLDPARPPVVRIGDRCHIGRGNAIVARLSIDIEDDVMTAPNVYVTDHNHTYANLDIPIGQQWMVEAPVRIGAGSWLGTGVVVLPGADIGRHVTVAAGSVVRGVLPDNCVAAGAPAKVVRQYIEGRGWIPEGDPPPPAPPGWPGSA